MVIDPKAGPRIVDRLATRRKLLADRHCRSCGLLAANTHHLLGKGQRGDDVPDNLIPLCGSGSHGCHGALHGNPYTSRGVRWEAHTVRRAIGLRVQPLEFGYLCRKLGQTAALEHLRSQYRVELSAYFPLAFVPAAEYDRPG